MPTTYPMTVPTTLLLLLLLLQLTLLSILINVPLVRRGDKVGSSSSGTSRSRSTNGRSRSRSGSRSSCSTGSSSCSSGSTHVAPSTTSPPIHVAMPGNVSNISHEGPNYQTFTSTPTSSYTHNHATSVLTLLPVLLGLQSMLLRQRVVQRQSYTP
jgi:hypothetical protein